MSCLILPIRPFLSEKLRTKMLSLSIRSYANHNYLLNHHFATLQPSTNAHFAESLVRWRKHGLLRGRVYNARREYLYEPVGENRPVKNHGQRLSERRRFHEVACNPDKEVQYEA
jgi:hypothetical protein